MRFDEALGIHGVVIFTDRLEAEARLWERASGLPVLRRSRREIVLGYGPELFVALRRAPRGRQTGVGELHLAVRKLRAAGSSPDALGGRNVEREISGLSLTVREFERPAGGLWKRKRSTAAAGKPPRPGGRGRTRSNRRGNR